jgi:phage shock protein PspC (stress-responsive transcriptional regulator)
MTHAEAAPAAKKASLIGVCQAVGDGLGFNADFLRVALAISLIVKPEYTLIVYGILAVTVLASRLLVREPRRAKAVRQPEPAQAVEPMRVAA